MTNLYCAVCFDITSNIQGMILLNLKLAQEHDPFVKLFVSISSL